MLVFRKFWCTLFSCNTHFDIRPFALLPTKYWTLGVGQVVLQAAASNKFKECFGIEKAETPAYFAKELEKEFKKWMNWFGKIYTDFTVI